MTKDFFSFMKSNFDLYEMVNDGDRSETLEKRQL